MREILEKEKPRVWLKAFWGFDPSEEGYLGFTKAGDQLSFISEAKNSDLVLIYGSTSEETDIADRRQALGSLDICCSGYKSVENQTTN